MFQECKKAWENVVAVGKPILRIPLLKSFLILNAGVAGGDWQQSGRFFAQFLPLRVVAAACGYDDRRCGAEQRFQRIALSDKVEK